MYSDNKMVLQLASLLKQYNIRRIVISPGSRHVPLVHSLESDPYFKLYSVVDERSAAFFALGLIQQTGEIAAVTCSSGTACMNYGSAIVEAFYQKLPLLVLSSDRIPALLNQLEDQMYDQLDTFTNCTKYQGQLPVVHNELDEWYCNRIINEGLLELTHHGKGPVHLNIPIFAHNTDTFSTKILPSARKISIKTASATETEWNHVSDSLKGRKVMIVCGQSVNFSLELEKSINRFVEKYDAIILTDMISNCHCLNSITNTTIVLGIMKPEERLALSPDVVITIGGNYIFNNELKDYLKPSKIEHWQVGCESKVCDPFHQLNEIFEMPEAFFFSKLIENNMNNNDANYAASWINLAQLPTPPISNYNEMYAIGQLLSNLPKNVDLQLANSCTIRMSHLFPIDSSIRVNCNRGVNGIDGSLSTAVGFSAENKRPTFFITGDLSFFYDMNALWIKHLSSQMRILLINNYGGAVMCAPLDSEEIKKLPIFIAGHNSNAKGWVESMGFKYISANSKEEVDAGINVLLDTKIDQPILLEVFTAIDSDAKCISQYMHSIDRKTFTERAILKLKREIKKIIK